MTKTLILAALIMALSGAASAQSSWSWTGENGASGGGTRDCSVAGSTRSCDTTRSSTGAYGHTRTVETGSTATYGARSATTTRTGTHGGTATVTRIWNR